MKKKTARKLTDEEMDAYKQTSLGWQSENLKIINKKSKLVPFNHNIAQMKVHNAISLQRKYNLPIMLLIYKARKEGISTFIEACIFEEVNRNENRYGTIVSVDEVSTAKVFRMFTTFQDEMPANIKRKTIRASAKEIAYDKPHRSSMLCQTAGKKVIGRGGDSHYVHATEVTFWSHAERQLLSLLNEIPDEPYTMQILETTANGTGNAFSKEYWAAVKRLRNLYKINPKTGKKEIDPTVLRGYLPLFLSWQDFPEYRIPLPKGRRSVPGMTQEMREYVKEGLAMNPPVVLDPEQIYFALLKVQNKCAGDFDLFKQEYPRTARESERATGRMVFKPMDIDRMERHCVDPKDTVIFRMAGDGDKNNVKFKRVNRRTKCWSIWKHPQSNHSYCLFSDVAEGVLSDQTDKKSEADRSVSIVLDRNTFEFVAVYYGRPDTITFGDQSLMAAKYYNMAWATPEMNSIGQSILDTFRRDNYPYIYQREHHEDRDVTEDSKLLGWKTTTKTRKPMIADLVECVREDEIIIYDIRILDEFRTFIENRVGKPEAESGEFDDCVLCAGGVWQIHLRCQMDSELEEEDTSDDNAEPFDETLIMGASGDDDYDDEDDLESMYENMEEYE